MPKTTLSSRIKLAFLRIMEALGTTASHWARSAKLRVQEINLEARRHEILTGASLQAFELWHNGVKLPKELADMFKELSALDDKLSIVRAQKYAKVKVEDDEAIANGEAALPAEEETKAPVCEPPANQEAAHEPAPKSETKAAPQRARKTPVSAKRKTPAKPKE